MQNCCFKCQNRTISCHGECSKYAEYRKQNEQIYRDRRFSQLVSCTESNHYRDGWGFRRNGR